MGHELTHRSGPEFYEPNADPALPTIEGLQVRQGPAEFVSMLQFRQNFINGY